MPSSFLSFYLQVWPVAGHLLSNSLQNAASVLLHGIASLGLLWLLGSLGASQGELHSLAISSNVNSLAVGNAYSTE